jgi:hypothetical protein
LANAIPAKPPPMITILGRLEWGMFIWNLGLRFWVQGFGFRVLLLNYWMAKVRSFDRVRVKRIEMVLMNAKRSLIAPMAVASFFVLSPRAQSRGFSKQKR